MPPFIQIRPEGVVILVKVQPRASKNAVGEVVGRELKIKVSAPPVDSAANRAVVELLAQTLDCARGAVQIVRGQTSRHKQILVVGMKAEEIARRLTEGDHH